MSGYVVLARNDDGCWIVGPTVEAGGPKAAIRQSLEGVLSSVTPETTKTYVAVPARSWQPLTVKVENIQTLHIDAETEPGSAEPSA